MTKTHLLVTLFSCLTLPAYADTKPKEDTSALCKKAESPLFATDSKDQTRRFSLEHSTRLALFANSDTPSQIKKRLPQLPTDYEIDFFCLTLIANRGEVFKDRSTFNKALGKPIALDNGTVGKVRRAIDGISVTAQFPAAKFVTVVLPLDYPKEVKPGDKIEVVGYLSIWNSFPVVVTNAVLPTGTIAGLRSALTPPQSP